MAVNNSEYPFGSPLVHVQNCEIHGLPIDLICEECVEFICANCARHKDHEWKTLPTAATERKRGLLEFLRNIKEDGLPNIEEKIEKMSKQIAENKEVCDSEIKKLRKHYDKIMARLTEIRIHHEQTLRENLIKKNGQLNHIKTELEKRKRVIVDTVEFMEENNNNMSDYSLIDNHSELTKLLSELNVHMTICEHSVRFTRGEINDDLLQSLVGKTVDSNNIGVTQINAFRYGGNTITVLETFNEDRCYIRGHKSEYTEKVNKEGVKEHNSFDIIPYDLCVTNTGDVYYTNARNKSVCFLSPSRSIFKIFSSESLVPRGICISRIGGLLVIFTNSESDLCNLQSQSRCFVRHITLMGDLIHEYEYKKDGHTRLFTFPVRITQNSNSDICVVNRTNNTTGELVIISPSGHLKSVFRGQNLTEDFRPTDVACDSLWHILVTDLYNNRIHLLSPDGEFLKFLLTENEVSRPSALSLYKSTLWVGYREGFVKVFQYRT
ncbi:uncharacterized protein LOC134271194 [Saccostrea cucullata]|uniref:uncharacterized protein LOC134271194 n=1 Tax=Saccostrea cuccullata TaxID=36930 RepID=UPI002ED307D2